MKLLLATRNVGKALEYRDLLRGLPYEPCDLIAAGIEWTAEETGATFEQNALIKARAYASASGLVTLADDSGLEVDALGGEPGVMSARYGGLGTDEARYRLLLHRLEGVSDELRTARFCCVIAVVWPGGLAETATGTCEGTIAREPRGTNGFGYDPIFLLYETGCTMAELPAAVKNRVSHRARAAAGLRAMLQRGEPPANL